MSKNSDKLSVSEIADIYCRFKSPGTSSAKVELDLEQLLFHALSHLTKEELEAVRDRFISHIPRPEGWQPKKFPEHNAPELDPESPIHPSNKITRY